MYLSCSRLTSHLAAGPGDLKWNDGRLAVQWNMDLRAVVTTPNAKWMPEFPVATPGQIITRADGRWGPQEFTLWPQLFAREVAHHACIPTPEANVSGVRALEELYEVFDERMWHPDEACGVPDLGFFDVEARTRLFGAVDKCFDRWRSASVGGRSGDRGWGDNLRLTILRGMDQLTRLPSTARRAVLLAVHIQRLALELCGLTVFYEIVKSRMAQPAFFAQAVLPVRGAFTVDPSIAQELFRLGIPFWFIQPWTKQVRVVEVGWPEPVRTKLDIELSYPRLDTTAEGMDGLINHPGRWPYKMQQEVLKTLLDNALPPLPLPAPIASVAPPAKKAKVAHPPKSAARAPPIVAASSSTTAPAAAPVKVKQLPPPFLLHSASSTVQVPEVWHKALTAAGQLPRNESPALYYWPPPFLLEPEKGKASHYRHNYLRIRGFCRQRLVDKQVNAHPLNVWQWRDTLWGDYRSSEEEPRAEVKGRNLERHKSKQASRALFGSTGGLPSYDASAVVQWGERTLTLQDVNEAGLRAQITWEAHKVNWQCEFLELDSILTGSRHLTTFARWEREVEVCSVWSPQGSGLRVVPRWEQREPNTATWGRPPSLFWDDSIPTLRQFLAVMQRWPGLPDELRRVTLSALQPDTYAKVQEAVVAFYVRSFISKYHRLPVPPAVCPANWL